MRGRIFSAFMILSILTCFSDAAIPGWVEPGASFNYHGYGSSTVGAAVFFMDYTVESRDESAIAVRRDSTESTFGVSLESKVMPYLQTDQAGDFWLDTSQSFAVGDTIMVHTELGYAPATLEARGPLELGDPQYGQQQYNDLMVFTMTSEASDKRTQINYNYYYDGETGLLISYSEYVGANLGKPNQELTSKVIVYLIKANADLTKAQKSQPRNLNPPEPVMTAKTTVPQTTIPDANADKMPYCWNAITLAIAVSCSLFAKIVSV